MVIDGLQQAGAESTVHLDGQSDDLSVTRTESDDERFGKAPRVRHYEQLVYCDVRQEVLRCRELL